MSENILGWSDPDCDYEGPASVYLMADGTTKCRCMVCGRCDHHTGNNTQGHFWAMCSFSKKIEEFHFCCPGDCELFGAY